MPRKTVETYPPSFGEMICCLALILGETSDSGHDPGSYGEAKSREILHQLRTIFRAVYNWGPRFEIRAENGAIPDEKGGSQ